MIFLTNISFIYIIIFIIIYNISSITFRNRRVSNILLFIGSITILSTLTTINSLGIIIAISTLVFFAGYFLNKKPQSNKVYLSIFIGILIALFVVKNYKLAELALLQRIGISYVLFRLIHFLIDSFNKKIHEYNLLNFLNYIIFFPSFIAGPIDEYNNSSYWIKQRRNSYKVLLFKAGIFKLLLGIVKKFFLVPLIINYSLDFSLFEESLIWQENLLASLFFYSLYILFDFSGYSDIAIGTAYLIGIKTPENFDSPYFSTNLSLFWKKWHMTFSNFLFKYLFKPLVTNLSIHLHKYPRLVVSSLGYLITFTICGIWHGNTLNFIYWGLWHGFGLILFKLWDIYLYQKKVNKINNIIFLKIYKVGAICVTFIFVTLGWFFFNYETNEVSMILNNITTKNDKEISVSSVSFNSDTYYKIVYDNKEASNIDIAFISSERTVPVEYFNVPINDDNTYYLKTKEDIKKLLHIKIRPSNTKEIAEWHSALLYVGIKDFNQNWFDESFFQKREIPPLKLKEEPRNILIGKTYLTPEYLNQKIEAKAKFIEDYGWAISLKYKSNPNYKVMVDYQYESNNWITYDYKRDGKYDYIDLHGHETFNETDRNLTPGDYNIRLKYYDSFTESNWITTSISIPNYVNN
jgi:D-alanyl-lipoteichoic acid acyltransferase DltB (MBOAT superfamily)